MERIRSAKKEHFPIFQLSCDLGIISSILYAHAEQLIVTSLFFLDIFRYYNYMTLQSEKKETTQHVRTKIMSHVMLRLSSATVIVHSFLFAFVHLYNVYHIVLSHLETAQHSQAHLNVVNL